MEDLNITHGGQIIVPDDNVLLFTRIVEEEIDLDGDWSGIAALIAGASAVPDALELKKRHRGLVIGTFDIGTVQYEAIEAGDLLFAIDQQPYLQGYLPIPILVHDFVTRQHFLNHAIEASQMIFKITYSLFRSQITQLC